MMKNRFGLGLLFIGLMSTTSCIDDKYDLDNIDTTSAIKVNDLVVPVNLESVTLDKVFDIDESDPDNIIVKYTYPDGTQVFAIQKTGDFNAEDVFINEIAATEATVSPLSIPVNPGSYNLPESSTTYYYHISDVDSSITGVSSMKMSEPMEINLTVSSDAGNVTLDNVVISLPQSFVATYNGENVVNGSVNVGSITNGYLEYPIYVYEIDFGYTDQTEGELSFDGTIGIKSATANISGSASSLNVQFSMSGFIVNEISGSVNYEIEAPEFEPVSLEDLPEFLREGESNLIISNPQIYLNFSNPVNAPVYSDLSIISEKEGEEYNWISTDLVPFMNNLILAADVDDIALENDFPGAEKQEITDLRYILACDGLPTNINFNLMNTYVKGEINNFVLGQGLSFNGKYSFFTPLSLAPGSQIEYIKTETDFFGDDVKDVKVSKFQLTAYPTTNLPFSVKLQVSPLDKNGNIINGANGSPIVATGDIDAYADGSKPLDIDFNEPFSGLDGIKFSVIADANDEEALTPQQYIKLDKIRAKISGEYVTDF